MARAEQRPARTISWSDLAIGIFFTWLGEKVLDFILRRVEAKAKFEGETHFDLYFFKVFYGLYGLMDTFALGVINLIIDREKARPFPSDSVMFKQFQYELRSLLATHRTRHFYGFVKDESCRMCPLISANKKILQHFVTDASYYPPFSRGSLAR